MTDAELDAGEKISRVLMNLPRVLEHAAYLIEVDPDGLRAHLQLQLKLIEGLNRELPAPRERVITVGVKGSVPS